jgi:hypothetical protein
MSSWRSAACRTMPALWAVVIVSLGLVSQAIPSAGSRATAAQTTAQPLRAAPSVPRYRGIRCPDPVGHRVTQCRLGIHGTPDLSRRSWARLAREVTVSAPFRDLTANGAAAGERSWPLLDSLGLPMGTLRQDERGKVRLAAISGEDFSVVAMNVRGHGCAASTRQMRTMTLVQLIAPKAPSHGTQAFLDVRAVADPAAAAAFHAQRGGGTGCGPSGARRGRPRPLTDPAVGADAHTRLSNGALNTVTEYDAKPAFGGTVYFMTNTTSVRVGGITRGMVRTGTPVITVDRFARCDPSSDGTLTWRYVAIPTAQAARPYLYGWIPARCPARLRH